MAAAAAHAGKAAATPGLQGTLLIDFGQPLVSIIPLQLNQLHISTTSSGAGTQPPTSACGPQQQQQQQRKHGGSNSQGSADALLFVGAHGRLLLLHAAPRLPAALAPLLRVLHASSGGRLCVNRLATHERQLPLQLRAARLVYAAAAQASARLALVSRQGALHVCNLAFSVGDSSGGGSSSGGSNSGAADAAAASAAASLPERLDAHVIPLPAPVRALAACARPGHVTAITMAGAALEVPLGAKALQSGAPAARARVRCIAAGMRRLGAVRDELQQQGVALDAAYSSVLQEVQLLTGRGPATANHGGAAAVQGHMYGWGEALGANAAALAHGGMVAPLLAGKGSGWGGCGDIRACMQLERVWAAPAAACSVDGAAAALHLAVTVQLLNVSSRQALGGGWQLVLSWVPEAAQQPGWQTGVHVAPLAPGSMCRASMLLPLPGSESHPLQDRRGGWLQLMLIRRGAGISSCLFGSDAARPGLGTACSSGSGGSGSNYFPAAALLGRLRVGALCLGRLAQASQHGSFSSCAQPRFDAGGRSGSGNTLLPACIHQGHGHGLGAAAAGSRRRPGDLPFRCLMQFRVRSASGAVRAPSKRRKFAGASEVVAGRQQLQHQVDQGQQQQQQQGCYLGQPQQDMVAPITDWLEAVLAGPVSSMSPLSQQQHQQTWSGLSFVLPDGSSGVSSGGSSSSQVSFSHSQGVVEVDWEATHGSPQQHGQLVAPGVAAASGAAAAWPAASKKLLVRLRGSSVCGVAEVHGVLSEALRAQLSLLRFQMAQATTGKEEAASWGLESDRERLQLALRRLQQLQRVVGQLRVRLREVLQLRERCSAHGPVAAKAESAATGGAAGGATGTGAGGDGCGAASDVRQLMVAIGRLRGGAEQAYGQMLLATSDACRAFTVAGCGG